MAVFNPDPPSVTRKILVYITDSVMRKTKRSNSDVKITFHNCPGETV